MRRAAAICLALLVSIGAALLVYRALSDFLLGRPATIGRSPILATEDRNQEGAPALAGVPPANPDPRSLEEKQ